jgi:hypothetical protein
MGQAWWLMLIIPAIWEAIVRAFAVQGHLGKKIKKTPISTSYSGGHR